ncbi:MAG: TrmH family RNA methyltransferase [Hyphomicrobiaceae bacterium]
MREPLVITSLQNERVKLIRSLEMRKVRRETGLFVAEGASILVTARDNGWTPDTLVALRQPESGTAVGRDLIRWAMQSNVAVLDVSQAVMTKLASKDNPQTMLGMFRQRWAELPDPGSLQPGDVWLALEQVRDPGNLGTIVRTVDAVGASGVILVGPCCDPYSREAVRATMGSIFAVPLARASQDEFLAWAAGWPGDIVGTHLDAREDFRKARWTEPVLLVMGSEGAGMSDELRDACRRLVKIPMAGRLDSLNLAVATALTLYQIRSDKLKL